MQCLRCFYFYFKSIGGKEINVICQACNFSNKFSNTRAQHIGFYLSYDIKITVITSGFIHYVCNVVTKYEVYR